MSNFKPGEFKVTDQALGIWNLPKSAEVLDIGCGQGETVEYLEKEYGYKVCGIDLSNDLIKQGLDRNPNLNIQYGDGEFLDGFLSYSFDGVMMECVLSLIGLPDEAIHEAYCVLKKGGKLFISDLYLKDPEPEFLKAVELEAEKERNTPHHHDHDHEGGYESGHSEDGCAEHTEESGGCSDCDDCGECDGEEHESVIVEEPRYRTVNFRSDGRFLMTPLVEQLQEIGYTNIQWKDCSKELDNSVAEKMMSLKPHDKYQTGFFMLTAEKAQ